LRNFQHTPPTFKQYTPYPYQRINYHNQNTQTPMPIDTTPLLDTKDTKYVQQVIGALLHYIRAIIGCTMLLTLSTITHIQAAPRTQFTKKNDNSSVTLLCH